MPLPLVVGVVRIQVITTRPEEGSLVMPENENTPTEQTEAPEAADAPEDAPEREEQDAPEQTEDSEEFDPKRAMAKIRKQNQENKSLRDRTKELEAKLREYEDANKSEAEKVTERLTAAEKAANESGLTALRFEVALEKGLTKAQAKRLIGSTKEELEADAEELLETFGKRRLTKQPNENLRGGSEPAKPVEETDPRKLAAKIRRPYS